MSASQKEREQAALRTLADEVLQVNNEAYFIPDTTPNLDAEMPIPSNPLYPDCTITWGGRSRYDGVAIRYEVALRGIGCKDPLLIHVGAVLKATVEQRRRAVAKALHELADGRRQKLIAQVKAPDC